MRNTPPPITTMKPSHKAMLPIGSPSSAEAAPSMSLDCLMRITCKLVFAASLTVSERAQRVKFVENESDPKLSRVVSETSK